MLPIIIYDPDKQDIKLYESFLGGALRGVEFVYKSFGVNSLTAREPSVDEAIAATMAVNGKISTGTSAKKKSRETTADLFL